MIDGELELIFNRVAELDPAANPLYSALDDISTGRLFADVFQDLARYNTTRRAWMIYAPRRGTWGTDEQSTGAGKLAMTFQRALCIYAADKAESYQKFVVGLASSKRRETMLRDASRFYAMSDSQLDNNPRLLNCRNCVLDLESMKAVPHSPDLLLTRCTGAAYDPDADGTQWNVFIDQIMSGDKEKAAYLQRVFGVSLDGGIAVKRLFFLFGPATNNGKSTLLETFGSVVGDYGTTARSETFTDTGNTESGSRPSEDVARLAGVRFVSVSEFRKRAILDAATCKRITGRTKLTARFLNQGSFTFMPQFTLVNECNSLPQIKDLTMFSSGRVSVVRFDAEFKPDDPGTNPSLLEELQQPQNQSAALNWALDGLRAYHENGDKLDEPQCVKQAVAEYQEHSDKLRQFIADCLIPAPGVNTAGSEAYTAYDMWCSANGFGVESKPNFFADLKDRGLFKASGTINGRTVRNVIPGFMLDADAWGRPKTGPF